MDPLYFGIDVAKHKLDLATASKHLGVFENNNQGHRQLIQKINTLAAEAGLTPTAVLEASGGYERNPLKALLDAGVHAALVQPGCVRNFAKAGKIHAKNDAADAKGIARFAEVMKPRLAMKVPPAEEKLRSLQDRREQVIGDRVRESNREKQCPDASIRRRITASIKRLRKEEAKLDDQIDRIIREDELLAAKADRIQEVKGVGPRTAAVLLAHMPELGKLNRRQVAALAGLAPYDRDSGRAKGARSVFAGRGKVRKLLYMCAVSCSRHNPVLRPMYQRLLAAGKKPMVALVALARKLLTYLNSQVARLLDTERCLGAEGRYC